MSGLLSTLSPGYLSPGPHKDSKFAAWAGATRAQHGIRLQRGGVRSDQRRHYIHLPFDEDAVAAEAKRFPHGTFFLYDEPDGDGAIGADEYARIYAKFVSSIRSGSATAHASPAGFVYPDSIHYIDKFYDACRARNIRIDEWRFHTDYGPSADDYEKWELDVATARDWAVARGARMVLVWACHKTVSEGDDMLDHLSKAMDMISNDNSIVEAVWWAYNRADHHNLINPDGTLTADGQLFVQLM